jgi:uncharacterized protein YecE (DUF72 family)
VVRPGAPLLPLLSQAPADREPAKPPDRGAGHHGGLQPKDPHGERLGLCFLQLPPNFGPAGVTELRQYLLGVPPELPLAVELRHPGWYRDPLARETFAFLSSRGIGTVITDTLGRRDAVHMRLTTPQAFVRFVGNDLHRSDYTRIEEWAARLEQWVGQGLEELYFFVHEPKETHTLTLAAYLEEKLRERSLAPVATT